MAVSAVYRSKADEGKLCFIRNDPGHPRAAEDLNEVELLPLVNHIYDLIGMIIIYPPYKGRKIRGIIKRCPIRLQYHAGRYLLFVILPLHVNYESAVAFMGKPFVFQHLYHAGDVGLSVRFSLPKIKGDLKPLIISFEIGNGDLHYP